MIQMKQCSYATCYKYSLSGVSMYGGLFSSFCCELSFCAIRLQLVSFILDAILCIKQCDLLNAKSTFQCTKSKEIGHHLEETTSSIFRPFCMTLWRIHVNNSVAIKYKSLYTRESIFYCRQVCKGLLFLRKKEESF